MVTKNNLQTPKDDTTPGFGIEGHMATITMFIHIVIALMYMMITTATHTVIAIHTLNSQNKNYSYLSNTARAGAASKPIVRSGKQHSIYSPGST